MTTNKWWGVIKKTQDIELIEFKLGDTAKIRRAYMNEHDVDFVIEPFVAENFCDAKIWVQDCVESSKVLSWEIMCHCNENSKKELDIANKQ